MFRFVPKEKLDSAFPEAKFTDTAELTQKLQHDGVYFSVPVKGRAYFDIGIVGNCPHLVVDPDDPNRGFCTAGTDNGKCLIDDIKYSITKV